MIEKVLVLKRSEVDSLYGVSQEKLIKINFDEFINNVDKSHQFIPRNLAENDDSFKQIIAYCIITCGSKIFVTKRLKKQTEIRLHDMLSVGVGGHINPIDCADGNVVMQGMARELSEEVYIGSTFTYRFLGLINDNSTAVNTVHAGACFEVNLDMPECSVREVEKMEGFWVDKDDIPSVYDKMEGWSKIVLNSFIGDIYD